MAAFVRGEDTSAQIFRSLLESTAADHSAGGSAASAAVLSRSAPPSPAPAVTAALLRTPAEPWMGLPPSAPIIRLPLAAATVASAPDEAHSRTSASPLLPLTQRPHAARIPVPLPGSPVAIQYVLRRASAAATAAPAGAAFASNAACAPDCSLAASGVVEASAGVATPALTSAPRGGRIICSSLERLHDKDIGGTDAPALLALLHHAEPLMRGALQREPSAAAVPLLTGGSGGASDAAVSAGSGLELDPAALLPPGAHFAVLTLAVGQAARFLLPAALLEGTAGTGVPFRCGRPAKAALIQSTSARDVGFTAPHRCEGGPSQAEVAAWCNSAGMSCDAAAVAAAAFEAAQATPALEGSEDATAGGNGGAATLCSSCRCAAWLDVLLVAAEEPLPLPPSLRARLKLHSSTSGAAAATVAAAALPSGSSSAVSAAAANDDGSAALPDREAEERDEFLRDPPPPIRKRALSALRHKSEGNAALRAGDLAGAKRCYDMGLARLLVSGGEWRWSRHANDTDDDDEAVGSTADADPALLSTRDRAAGPSAASPADADATESSATARTADAVEDGRAAASRRPRVPSITAGDKRRLLHLRLQLHLNRCAVLLRQADAALAALSTSPSPRSVGGTGGDSYSSGGRADNFAKAVAAGDELILSAAWDADTTLGMCPPADSGAAADASSAFLGTADEERRQLLQRGGPAIDAAGCRAKATFRRAAAHTLAARAALARDGCTPKLFWDPDAALADADKAVSLLAEAAHVLEAAGKPVDAGIATAAAEAAAVKRRIQIAARAKEAALRSSALAGAFLRPARATAAAAASASAAGAAAAGVHHDGDGDAEADEMPALE